MAATRLSGLDVLRGMGAMLVLLLHLHYEAGGLAIFGRAYLAVDLFFILSGFVFSGAYDRKLALGIVSWCGFLRNRLARLFPAIFVGLVLGALNFGLRGVANDVFFPALLAQAVMLPVFWMPHVPAFPLNTPQWSLMYELAANLLYARIVRRLHGGVLPAIVAISGLAFLVAIARNGSADVGSMPETMVAAVPRVLFGFFGGLLLGRIWHGGKGWQPRGLGLLAFAAFPLSIVLVQSLDVPATVGDACLIFILFPALIWCAASAELGTGWNRFASAAGDLSYPLYAFHVPLLGIAGTMLWLLQFGSTASRLAWIATTMLIVLAAWGFGAWERASRESRPRSGARKTVLACGAPRLTFRHSSPGGGGDREAVEG